MTINSKQPRVGLAGGGLAQLLPLQHVGFSCIAWSVQSALPIHRTGPVSSTRICFSPLLLIRLNVAAITILPAILIWFTPGAAWFHNELIPDPHGSFASVDTRTRMAIWQLGNCTFRSLCFSTHPDIWVQYDRLSATWDALVLVFRATRDALPGNPAAQERIVGASLLAMAIADVSHPLIIWLHELTHDNFCVSQATQ